MRQWRHSKLRIATLVLCGVAAALGLASFGLAFTVRGPSRTLRPILTYADSAYLPLYIGMTAAALVTLAGIVGLLSALYGNRGVDLAVCLALLPAAGLALAALGLAGAMKGNAQTGLEATLSESLKRYGRDDPAAFDAWNEMQSDGRCCAVRTNRAQVAYETTPWYQEMRVGNPHTAPKIPTSCCTAEANKNPGQLADCTNNKPSVPAQNPYMHPVGCFEAMGDTLDAFSTRYIVIGAVVFLGAGAALGPIVYGLVLSLREGAGSGGSPVKGQQQQLPQQQFGNSRPGSVAGGGLRSQQPLMSQSLGAGSSVYNSRHSLFSEPPPAHRPPSETSLPSLAARSLFSEPPTRSAAAPIQAQPVRPRPRQQLPHHPHQQAPHQAHQQPPHQTHQQPPVPKPRSTLTASVAATADESSVGGASASMSQQPPSLPPQQKQQKDPQKQKKQQKQQQPKAAPPAQPIVLSAQPLRRPQHPAVRHQPPPPQAGGRKRESNF